MNLMDWLAETLIAHPVFSLLVLIGMTAFAAFLAIRQLALGVRMFRRKQALLRKLVRTVADPDERRLRV